MKLLLNILLVFFLIKSNAQSIMSSNTTVESCNDIEECLTVSNLSYLYYDETKNEFFLKIDFSNFRSKPESIDNWLNKERDTCLYFRMIFPKENFPVLGIEERKNFKVNGRIFYSNTWKDQPIEMTLYASQNSLMNAAPGSTYTFENYKVNFTLPFVPTDFKDYEEFYYYDQAININVTLGRINVIKPGMEILLSEVYDLPNR